MHTPTSTPTSTQALVLDTSLPAEPRRELDARVEQLFEIPVPSLVLDNVRRVTVIPQEGAGRTLDARDLVGLGGDRLAVRVPRGVHGTIEVTLNDGRTLTLSARVRSPERTYCAWAATVEETLLGALMTLGYGTPTSHGSTVFDTAPRADGVALHVDVVNLVGVTYVQVRPVPAQGTDAATDALFAELERSLVMDGCN